jgi:nicotinamidase-related amidase
MEVHMDVASSLGFVNSVPQEKLARIAQTHRADACRTALLVIDMQHAFLDEGASLCVPAGRAIVPAVRSLIDGFRRARAPVIFTEFVYSRAVPCLRGDPFGPEHLPAAPGAPTGFGHPSSNCLVGPQNGEGPESAATIDALAPRAEELVIAAHAYDKFLGTPLDLALRSQGIDRIVATGVTTDVCVNSTVLAAANRNYRAIVAVDGVATIHDRLQVACLEIWQNKFARLAGSEEILSELA